MLNLENKVLERLVYKYLFNHLRDNNLLSALQSGFLPGDSTLNQLTFLYNTFCHALDSSKEVRTVFCDISKAFDRVCMLAFLLTFTKLVSQETSMQCLQIISPTENNELFSLVLFSIGLLFMLEFHNGPILGPLLFSLYINNIVHDIDSNIRLFAYDTSLSIIVDDLVTAAGY